MNTDFFQFDPPRTPPAPPAPAVVPPPQPQVVVLQTPARAMFVGFLGLVFGVFSVGCTVGDYVASHRVRPTPAPAPAPPAPGPKPGPLPPGPTPPAPVVDAYTGVVHVSLIYDPNVQADMTATANLRSDAALAGRLKANQAEWYPLDLATAKSLGWDKAAGWPGKTPMVAVQKDNDPRNPSFFPVPAASDDLVALIAEYRKGVDR